MILSVKQTVLQWNRFWLVMQISKLFSDQLYRRDGNTELSQLSSACDDNIYIYIIYFLCHSRHIFPPRPRCMRRDTGQEPAI